MSRAHRGAAVLVSAALIYAAPAVSQAAGIETSQTGSGPATVFVPPKSKQLSPDDIVVTRGPGKRQVSLSTTSGGPLAVLLVTTSADGRVRIKSPGYDFSDPTTWQQLGFGDICWSANLPDAESFTLPDPVLPFPGPPGQWTYSNVMVWTDQGPVVYNKPLPGEFVTGQGSPMQIVIPCVNYAGAQTPELPTTTLALEPVLPEASRAPVLPSKSPESLPAEVTGPDPASDQPTGTVNQGTQQQVTICHATVSESNPYSLLTLTEAGLKSHESHTGPLYPQVGWGDIIPPVDGITPGLNWPAGQGLLDNGCVPVDPPIDPWPPVNPPTKPVKPEPPILVIPPIDPGSPEATPSVPIATITPGQSATPSLPIATQTPEPTNSPEPSTSASPTPTLTSTPTSPPTITPSSTPSVSPSLTPGTTESATPTGTPEVTTSPATTPVSTVTPLPPDLSERLGAFCETKDPDLLPASIRDSRTTMLVTNGVSTLTINRPYTNLYCKAVQKPETDDSETPETGGLVDTGVPVQPWLPALVVLLGAAFILVPATRRHT